MRNFIPDTEPLLRSILLCANLRKITNLNYNMKTKNEKRQAARKAAESRSAERKAQRNSRTDNTGMMPRGKGRSSVPQSKTKKK